jgi:RNA polymerase sigma-70 factor (ECF subfamily)
MPPNDDDLARAFLNALPSPRAEAPSPGGLGATLRQALRTAREAWPALEVPPEAFAAYLAPRLPPSALGPGLAALGALYAADLYLACACARRDPRALVAFEARYFRDVDRALGRAGLAPAAADDVKGELRERLLFPKEGGPSLLAGYSGRSALGTWLYSVAAREALKVSRQRRGEAGDGARLDDVAVPDGDPELTYLRATFATEFRSALAAALDALTARQRNLLRQHLVDGLTIDQLGKIYHKHRATVARQIADVREQVALDVRRQLVERLRLSEAELESALRLVRSRLDLSIRRVRYSNRVSAGRWRASGRPARVGAGGWAWRTFRCC